MNYLLIGRPNVGKSSIFNILTRKNVNITHKESGTTRDWHKEEIYLTNNIYIYDTPGLILNSSNEDEINSKAILEELILQSHVLLLVIDFQSKLNPQDQSILNWLRIFDKEIILLVNKRDNLKKDHK